MSRRTHGFSLIDVIVGIALLLILFLALFGILRTSLTLSTLAKAKAAATELASSQIEYLHGISYDTIGTIGGIPAGSVAQNATSTVDGVTYAIRTYIVYKDDPADSIGVNDTNGITTDYKMGKVTVSYTMYGLTKSVVLATNFVPPGIETSTGGGTLSIHVVDAMGANMSGATVHVVNTVLTPNVDFTTFTNVAGLAIIDGALPSSEYQIYVSRPSGYSSAQTYAHVGQNTNPTPGYLTMVMNQVTSATFAIDKFAFLTLTSLSPAMTTSFSDTFLTASNLSSQMNTKVTSNGLTLMDTALFGSAKSIPLSPSYLDGWGMLSATTLVPTGTTAVVRVDDGTGTLLPDSVLPGNSSGFTSFPVSLTGVATSSYPILMLQANLTRADLTATSSFSNWSLSHTSGPFPVSNVAFTLTGAKTIGTGVNNVPLYKTIVNDTTGSSGTKTETLEWDSYKLTLGSSNLIESCTPTPYQLLPTIATTTVLLVGNPVPDVLPIIVTDSLGNVIGGARVVLTMGSYAGTIPTSSCGLAYFSGLSGGTYTAIVSATGHATTTFPTISVVSSTATTTLTLP